MQIVFLYQLGIENYCDQIIFFIRKMDVVFIFKFGQRCVGGVYQVWVQFGEFFWQGIINIDGK